MNNKITSHFEILYNDSPNPCSITDIETHELIFMNYAMQKMLKESSGVTLDNLSNLCYKRMYGFDKPCEFCQNHDLELDEFEESYVYNEKLEKYFRINNTLIKYKEKIYNLCKYFVTASYTNQLITFEEAVTESISIFSNKTDFNEMTSAFLKLIGKFYESDKAYIFYLNAERTEIDTHYEWVKDQDIHVITDVSSHVPMEIMLDFIERKNNNGITQVKNIRSNPNQTDEERLMLEAFGVENFTLCSVLDDKREIIGAVGFSNRAEKTFDPRLLHAVSGFVQEGFSKTDMKDELNNICQTDFLTGFYSRPKYIDTLTKYEYQKPSYLGAVFVNINGLRKTNEYMGFAKGDEQISDTANMLRAFFEENFYRISGDEFVCFCHDPTEKIFLKKVESLQNEIKRLNEFPFAVGHAWKEGNVDVQKLVAEADAVMFINKQEYYHSAHKSNLHDSDNVLTELLDCISNDEFSVYLQPQIDLTTEKVIGAEALIRRFDRKTQKMIFPDQFIPVYEQKSIIRHVDIFVVKKVCEILKKWSKTDKLIPISVNLSRVTLIEYDIVNTIAKICDKYEIPHEYICIEVTERIGIVENDVASSLIDEFKAQGFRLSLDDFGCAYSNIVTLAKISVDEVKIDKSLVDNLLTSEKNRIIVDSMIGMCNKFDDTHTLAEGIETGEHSKILKSYGCTYGQGYYYSRPIPSDEFYENYVRTL